jgi:SAM-dependent methyltransferase
VQCPSCKFIFQPECFSDELLDELYRADTSFEWESGGSESALIGRFLDLRRAVVSRAIADAGFVTGARVLDVGGGRGEVTRHLLDIGHSVVLADATVREPCDARIAKVSKFDDASLRGGTFDVVIMNHILEHTFSPSNLLRYGYEKLAPGGLLVVEVPFEMFTPVVARKLGDWRHVSYFTRATLRMFVAKAGFDDVRVRLETGYYGNRAIPVIRGTGRKTYSGPAKQQRNRMPILSDMASTAAVAYLLRRLLQKWF